MAKKIVRGITDVKTITNQDFDTNNVNDLLSDGNHNYIHRKKGKSEEYHNLTDNLKTILSSNTDLIDVTNNNTTNNTATLNPKHDAQKEQVLESTRNTVTINHGTNGTDEKTTVDTNPEKVLEHCNLLTDYGISKTKSGNTSKLGLEYTRVVDSFDLNNLKNGRVRSNNLTNAPLASTWFLVEAYSEDAYTWQRAIKLIDPNNPVFVRRSAGGVWGAWREQVGDKSTIDALLSQKQNTIQSNVSIGVSGTGLRQLYMSSYTFPATGALLKTHTKSISKNTNVEVSEEEFNFIVKFNKDVTNATFTINTPTATKFSNIITNYGSDNTVTINACVFTLNNRTLAVSRTLDTDKNYVITFSDII